MRFCSAAFDHCCSAVTAVSAAAAASAFGDDIDDHITGQPDQTQFRVSEESTRELLYILYFIRFFFSRFV